MPARIPEADIAAVRERSSIGDLVGEYVALRRAGADSLKGLCPFHDEKTPSFHVRPSVGVYHCFGCGASGDVIDFVQRVEHLSFVEAIERLAAKAGVRLRYENAGMAPRRTSGERARLLEAHTAAAAYYQERLAAPDAKIAREFLAVRGFDDDAARTFGCGFAPAGWDLLTKHLLQKGFTAKELVLAGLSREARSGSLIDRFRRRLLWPIRSIAGDVVGFGARKLFDDDDGPKYLNTPETPIYKKSEVLYGVDLAKREIARRRQAVIVEGYTDVMACHLAGVPTAVATCGTAFGGDHIGVLRRLLMDSEAFRGEVIYTFDGDEAGRKAALRAFRDEQKFVAQTFVAVERGGMDPCELRQAKGDAAVRDLVARREPLFAFAIRSVLSDYDLDTVEGRVQALRAAAPLVQQIKDRAMRPQYLRKLAGDLGMELDEVVAEIRRSANGSAGAAPRANGRPAGTNGIARPNPADGRFMVEREVLKLALQAPSVAGPMFDAVGAEAYVHPCYAAVRTAIATVGTAGDTVGGPSWVDATRQAATDDTVRGVISELAVESLRTSGEPSRRYAHELISRLSELVLDRDIAALKSKLQRINPVEDPDGHTRLFGELIALEQARRSLRDQAMGDGVL